MNVRALTVFFWVCLIASAAIASEKRETHIKIVTDDDNGVFEWQGTDAEADFSDLGIGESKTITGDDGRQVTVTRTEAGLQFDVDGKTIELMDVGGDGGVTVDVDVLHGAHGRQVAHESGEDGHGVVEQSRRVKIVRSDAAADVTIISSDQIAAETRARIRAALQEGGVEGEIVFIDGSELGGDAQAYGERDIRIVMKKIETTN